LALGGTDGENVGRILGCGPTTHFEFGFEKLTDPPIRKADLVLDEAIIAAEVILHPPDMPTALGPDINACLRSQKTAL
jgi:hypothetical protein